MSSSLNKSEPKMASKENIDSEHLGNTVTTAKGGDCIEATIKEDRKTPGLLPVIEATTTRTTIRRKGMNDKVSPSKRKKGKVVLWHGKQRPDLDRKLVLSNFGRFIICNVPLLSNELFIDRRGRD